MKSADNASTESSPPESDSRELRQTGGLRHVTMTAAAGTHHHQTEKLGTSDGYIGATIDGRYFVEKVLGEGGMGIVYRCRHTIIDKLVAMKVLRADMARNEEVTERFLNEARSASSIGNPHIIDISDFGRLPDGATYFIMEFLDGSPLASVIEKEKYLPLPRLLHVAHQMAEGLAAAHERGIVHRDLKPDNIFLQKRGNNPDFVKILDFGIAKAGAQNSKLTQAGQVFGTPHYMSPEQASGAEVDHRSDIYSLGVMIYELATGRLPFDADNFMAILTQHMYKEPTPPSQLSDLPAKVDPSLEVVILRAMAKSPADRYASMADLIADLETIDGGGSPVGFSPRRSIADSSPLFAARATTDKHDAGPASARRFAPFVIGGSLIFALAFVLTWKIAGEASPVTAETAPLAAAAKAAPPPQAPKAPEKKSVALAVAQLDAHVFEGERDLGTSPVLVEVGDVPLTLTIKKSGYETRELVVDGHEAKLTVSLVPTKSATKPSARITTAKPSPPPTTAVTKPAKKKSSSGDIVNPWGD